jgi:GntR family transcriptional regulator
MIDLDPASSVPLYLQISEQLRRLIALGALRPGDRLPTVRDLAVRTRVNRNTAARAIQHLEGAGVVRTRVGQGTFVERREGAGQAEAAMREIDASIDRLLVESHTAGVAPEELERRVRRKIEDFRERRRVSGAERAGETSEA